MSPRWVQVHEDGAVRDILPTYLSDALIAELSPDGTSRSSSRTAKELIVGSKAHHPSFDDDQLMKLCLLMILCLISDRFIIKILVGA